METLISRGDKALQIVFFKKQTSRAKKEVPKIAVNCEEKWAVL